MAWLSGYSKRKKITLTGGSSGAQTAYQLKLTVTYDSDMQADFDDLRFTKSDGTTLIDAWLESKTDSTSAVVWVETDTPANGSTADIYMYYGNSGASSDWDGDATFLQYHGAATSNFIDSEVLPNNVVYHARVRVNGTSDDVWWGMSNSSAATHIIRSRASKNLRYGYAYNGSGSGAYFSEAPKLQENVWCRLKITMSSSATHCYVDGDEIANGGSGYAPATNVALYLQQTAGSGEQEWSIAGKYVTNPATYSFGSEESLTSIPVMMRHYRNMRAA